MEQHSFGYWLKLKRKALDLTREELAERVGYSAATVRKIEDEERPPSEQVVEHLAEFFHIPPEERAAFLRFARGDWQFPPTEIKEVTPWHISAKSPRSNLPASISSLIGREQAIADIRNYLSTEDIRLVTLIGPPGIGKTRLSIEAARAELYDFQAGVFFIGLAPLEDANLVAPAIAQTLSVVEIQNRSPLERLKDGIGDKQMLIVLDNCEHLIDEIATLASDLLLACPRLKLLATSREALRAPGEWLYPVPTLSIPTDTQLQSIEMKDISQFTALSLFGERARAVRSDFTLNADNIRAVAMICTQLDCLPLAIELIAARIRLMSPQSLLSHLSEQFTLYADGMRALSARQKTLHGAISWSYDLLSDEEQKLFARLSVFSGGFTLEAAESIFSRTVTNKSIYDLITSLLDKSLLQRTLDRDAPREPRFTMLVTIQQFALERLRRMNEEAEVRNRHLAYFVDLAEQAEPNLRAFDMVMWLDRLEAELANLHGALGWAQKNNIEAQLRLASALLWFWHIRGHKNEGVDWLERGLSTEASQRGNQPLTPDRSMIRGKALNVTAVLLSILANTERSKSLSQEALTLFQELGSRGRKGMAYALLSLADAAVHLEDSKRVKILAEESLTLFREAGDKFGMAQCLDLLGGVIWEEGDSGQVKALWEDNLALRKEIGDRDGIARVLARLGMWAFSQDDLNRSVSMYEESLTIFREVGNEWARSYNLADLALVVQEQGNYGKATQILEEALAIARDLGDQYRASRSLHGLGRVAQLQGDYERATQMFQEALILARKVGEPTAIAESLQALGDIASAQGDYSQAAQLFEAELRIGQEKKIRWINAFALSGLGYVAWAQSDLELASKRLEEALKISREAGAKSIIGVALYCLGRVSQSQRDYGSARAHYTESLTIAKELALRDDIASNLEALATLYVAQSHMEPSPLRFEDLRRATCLFGVAEALYPPLLFEMSAAERAEHDQAEAAARTVLGEAAFASAWAEGNAMTREQAIAYALKLPFGPPKPLEKGLKPLQALTKREREVVTLIARGLSNGEIADELVLSKRTVEHHMSNILSKLGFANRAQIVRWAMENGLTQVSK
jgi:predicted ATPase/DNA-binding CsgD family transcriptional regulator/DNA-binding XRE family transcriptional regulator/Tfp pilus assembly protein PilF